MFYNPFRHQFRTTSKIRMRKILQFMVACGIFRGREQETRERTEVLHMTAQKEPEFVEEAEIASASESRQDDQQTALVVEAENPTAETVKASRSGRRPVEQGDKLVKSEFRSAPAMKEALTAFVEQLASSDFKAVIPDSGDTLALADVINAALLNYEPFKTFFETSEHYQEYIAWKERQQARQQYKTRKRQQQTSQDDNNDPDDDPNGGHPPLSEEAQAINREALAGSWVNDIITPAGRAMLTGLTDPSTSAKM
jgi:hypothetical protein